MCDVEEWKTIAYTHTHTHTHTHQSNSERESSGSVRLFSYCLPNYAWRGQVLAGEEVG
jgi:hypothetical protein